MQIYCRKNVIENVVFCGLYKTKVPGISHKNGQKSIFHRELFSKISNVFSDISNLIRFEIFEKTFDILLNNARWKIEIQKEIKKTRGKILKISNF